MIDAPRRAASDKRAWPADRRPFESPAGLRLLIPGWPQLAWGQRERGGVLLGSFVVALGAGILAWGTWSGGVSSRSHSSPMSARPPTRSARALSRSIPRRAAVPMIACALAALFYLPGLVTLVITAWPGFAPDRTRSVYLVNCWAYRRRRTSAGTLGLAPPAAGRPAPSGPGRRRGRPGSRVDRARVAGRRPGSPAPGPPPHGGLAPGLPLQGPGPPGPDRARGRGGSPRHTGSLVLVAQDQIIGRAWAQYYPVWDRRLL